LASFICLKSVYSDGITTTFTSSLYVALKSFSHFLLQCTCAFSCAMHRDGAGLKWGKGF